MESSQKFFRVFNLMDYDDAIRNALYLNKQTLGDKFYCKIPLYMEQEVEFVSVCEITHEDIAAEYISVSENNPWIDISTEAMNLSAGSHLYQFAFRDTRFGEMMYLYLYYNLQDDNPDKPYIYMDRGSDKA